LELHSPQILSTLITVHCTQLFPIMIVMFCVYKYPACLMFVTESLYIVPLLLCLLCFWILTWTGLDCEYGLPFNKHNCYWISRLLCLIVTQNCYYVMHQWNRWHDAKLILGL